ncbi:MAG: hypothetical protein ABI641_13480 [Caldimonas sp.]
MPAKPLHDPSAAAARAASLLRTQHIKPRSTPRARPGDVAQKVIALADRPVLVLVSPSRQP